MEVSLFLVIITLILVAVLICVHDDNNIIDPRVWFVLALGFITLVSIIVFVLSGKDVLTYSKIVFIILGGVLFADIVEYLYTMAVNDLHSAMSSRSRINH